MTHNQIEFQKLKETQQHNRATELQAQNDLYETQRSHQAIEAENQRHNLMQEALSASLNASSASLNYANAALANTRKDQEVLNSSSDRYYTALNYNLNKDKFEWSQKVDQANAMLGIANVNNAKNANTIKAFQAASSSLSTVTKLLTSSTTTGGQP